MKIKLIKTNEVLNVDTTMSSENGWYYVVDDIYYHESEVVEL